TALRKAGFIGCLPYARSQPRFLCGICIFGLNSDGLVYHFGDFYSSSETVDSDARKPRSGVRETASGAQQQVAGLAYVSGRGTRVADREANREAFVEARR